MEDVVGFFPDDRFVVRFRHLARKKKRHCSTRPPRAPVLPRRCFTMGNVLQPMDAFADACIKGGDVLPPHARAREDDPNISGVASTSAPHDVIATLPADVLADVVLHHLPLQSDRACFSEASRACRDAVRTARRLRAESKGAYLLSYLRTSRLSLTHFLDSPERLRWAAAIAPRGAQMLKNHACALAARQGHLETLAYLRETLRAEWGADVCAAAARYGHVDCLRYAHQNGCEWNRWTTGRRRGRRPRRLPRVRAGERVRVGLVHARGGGQGETRGLRDVRAEERVHFRRGIERDDGEPIFDEAAARATMVQEV